MNFENAPFKLTQDYMDLMEGPQSDKFEFFKSLIVRGLIEIRRNLDDLLSFIVIMSKGKCICFINYVLRLKYALF